MTREKEIRFLLLLSSAEIEGIPTKKKVLDQIYNEGWVDLTEEDEELMLNRNEKMWKNSFAFVRKHLVMEGYFSNSRNEWGITQNGRGYLKQLYQEVKQNTAFNLINLKAINECARLLHAHVDHENSDSENNDENNIFLKIFDETYDSVITSIYLVAKTNFESAVRYLVPMINKYNEQRYILGSKLYQKLEEDLVNGCIMPPITIAIQYSDSADLSGLNITELTKYVKSNIQKGYILDGIQRLNTLNRISKEGKMVSNPIYLNILLSDSKDKMLYRMVTLNNGQKPMSARHQIEVLADTIYDFNSLSVRLISEKEQKGKIKIPEGELSFKKENIIKAYIAYISGSTNIDNQKIISEKLDELITSKILETKVSQYSISFSDVIDLIVKFSERQYTYDWFCNSNNMIGFVSSIASHYSQMNEINNEEFESYVKKIEDSFKMLNTSKFNVGNARRKIVQYMVINYMEWMFYDGDELTDAISQII